MFNSKNIIGQKLQGFRYFYIYLKEKVFITIVLNILIGFLDGLGLAMFLPLLQLTEHSKKAHATGGYHTFINFYQSFGIDFTLQIALLLIASLFLLKGLMLYFKGVFQVKMQQNFIKSVRLENLENLSNLKYEYFVGADIGRIQNTLTGEVDKVSKACQSYFQSIQFFVLVIVYVAFAISLDWKFAVLVCVGGIVSDFIYRNIYKNTKGVSRKIASDSNFFQSLIFQAISNYKYLKATGEMKKYETKLSEQVEEIEKLNSRMGILGVILNASREPLSIIVVCLAILAQVSIFHTTMSAILISLLFFYRALSALMQFQTSWNTYLGLWGSMENIRKLNEELKENRQINGKSDVDSGFFAGKLELSNVNFHYGEKKVLGPINLEIRKSETLAIVGESGSGKTTLINLICGLLPVSEGKITLNGLNFQDLNLETYQQRLGLISQENVIFNDTIYNNVTLWAPRLPENLLKFEQACKKASIWSFIDSLPKKDESQLGTNGINLSGGQRQRISIARELFKDIEILILDEATSALDAETENEIQKSIELLKGQITMIVIAHRLSTIKPADRVAFLKNGELAAVGTFPEVYRDNADFRNLVDLQGVTMSVKNA